jgi:hypothetical protein
MATNIREMTKNPLKGSSFLISRKTIFDSLEKSYDKLYEKIELIGLERKLDTVTIFMRIPSEEDTSEIKYDLIIVVSVILKLLIYIYMLNL